MTDASRSALIFIEYVNDWLSPTGGIYPSFQNREQVDTAIANSKIILGEAHRRGMHVIHASLKFEPTFKVLGEAKYGLRKMMRDYGSFLGEQAGFFSPASSRRQASTLFANAPAAAASSSERRLTATCATTASSLPVGLFAAPVRRVFDAQCS